MSDVDKPAFPTLIRSCRSGQAPTWETCDGVNVDQRIKALEQDAGVVWFYAYDVKAYRCRSIKKTIVKLVTPTGDDSEGVV